MKLFAIISYMTGRNFSFEAENMDEAISAAKGWCRHHGFCYREEFKVEATQSKSNAAGQFDFHPEWLR